jgi:hypothetical protein
MRSTSDSGAADTLESIEVDATNPRDDDVPRLHTISASAVEELLKVRGLSRLDDSVLVAGSFVDCDSKPVKNAVVHVFDEQGNKLVPNTDDASFATIYYDDDGTAPSPERGGTNPRGRFVLINIPGDAGRLRVEVEGAPVDDGPLELVGCEQVVTLPGGMSYRQIGPLRRDAPEPCR